ncbi:zinc finger, CCHC-type containing protein [Tanacetum coccineum]
MRGDGRRQLQATASKSSSDGVMEVLTASETYDNLKENPRRFYGEARNVVRNIKRSSNWLERLLAGSISTWEDLTTSFLVQFFPPRRTAKLRNDIMMFQQHQGVSLSEAWTHFKDLLQNCAIDRAANGIFHDKNADESWEIIENLALYDHEGWNVSKDFKGSRSTPRSSSTHVPQAYAEVVYSKPHPQNFNESPRQSSFTFHERVCPNPQPQVLENSFEARVRDYMAAHTERMERLLKELTTSRDLEKLLIREEAKHPVTKNVNSNSLIRGEEEMNVDDNASSNDSIKRPDGSDTKVQLNEVEKKNEAENGTKNEPIKSAEKEPTQVEEEESAEAPSSQPVGYYLKHRINEKLIE